MPEIGKDTELNFIGRAPARAPVLSQNAIVVNIKNGGRPPTINRRKHR